MSNDPIEVITAPQPSCLPLDEVTFANEMKLAGYRTHAGFMIFTIFGYMYRFS